MLNYMYFHLPIFITILIVGMEHFVLHPQYFLDIVFIFIFSEHVTPI